MEHLWTFIEIDVYPKISDLIQWFTMVYQFTIIFPSFFPWTLLYFSGVPNFPSQAGVPMACLLNSASFVFKVPWSWSLACPDATRRVKPHRFGFRQPGPWSNLGPSTSPQCRFSVPPPTSPGVLTWESHWGSIMGKSVKCRKKSSWIRSP